MTTRSPRHEGLSSPGEPHFNRRSMEWALFVLIIIAFGPVASIVIVQGIEMLTMKRNDHH